MNLALDTNAYTGFCRGDETLKSLVLDAATVWLPLPVVAELRAGFALGEKAKANEANLQRFLDNPKVGVLRPNLQSTFHWASLFADLRRAGTPIPTNDLWIAALVLQHNVVLCSRDRHFDKIPQIPRVG
jgi:tRNA(fMet)-specific endonuclease VapC